MPEPEVRVTDGADTSPEMLPAPSVDRVAEVPALRFAPSVIEPPELAAVVRLAVVAVSTSDVVMLPLAVKANALPVEAPRFTDPLSVKATLPEVLADRLLALV